MIAMKVVKRIDGLCFEWDSDYYQNWDFSNAKPVSQVPALAKLQQKRREHLANQVQDLSIFDEDVQQLIKQHAHNKKDIERMNSMFRLLFA